MRSSAAVGRRRPATRPRRSSQTPVAVGEHGVEVGGAIARRRAPRPPPPRRPGRGERRSRSLSPGASTTGRLQRGAGIEAGADPAGRAARPSSAAGAASEPWRPMNSPRSPVQDCCRPPRSRKATRCRYSRLQELRASSAPVAASSSVTMNGTPAVARAVRAPIRRKPVTDRRRRRPETLRDRQPRDLHRIVARHELDELERDAVGGVLEAAVAAAVAGDVGRSTGCGSARPSAPTARRVPRRGCRSPRRTGSITGSFDHGVIWFSRLLIDQV